MPIEPREAQEKRREYIHRFVRSRSPFAGVEPGIVVVGYTYGSLCGTGAGGRDTIIASYSADDTLKWINQPGTTGAAWASGVAIGAAGQIFVVGAPGPRVHVRVGLTDHNVLSHIRRPLRRPRRRALNR